MLLLPHLLLATFYLIKSSQQGKEQIAAYIFINIYAHYRDIRS